MPSVECVRVCGLLFHCATGVSAKWLHCSHGEMSFSQGGERDEPRKRRGEKLRSGPERKGAEKGAAYRLTLPARLLWEGLKQLFG